MFRMKTLLNTTLVLAIALLSFSGCKKKIEGELGTPFDKLKGLNGTWELVKFTQTDLNNPIKEVRDLSEFYIQEGTTPLRIIFDAADFSYTVEVETGKNYFGEGGTWAFDDNDYPSYLILDSGTSVQELLLGRVVRESDNTLDVQLKRSCVDSDENETETVIYGFEFTRK